MVQVQVKSDKTGAEERVEGSDNRFNTSSRSDGRGYYNSRDESESYSAIFDDANASGGDYVLYVKNDTADGKHMVIRSVGVNCEAAGSSFALLTVTGTPAGGATVTPTNLNQAGISKIAAVTSQAPADSSVTPMTGLSDGNIIDCAGIAGAFGHQEFRLQDQVRIGQGQALAIKVDSATAADVRAFGVMFFYFE